MPLSLASFPGPRDFADLILAPFGAPTSWSGAGADAAFTKETSRAYYDLIGKAANPAKKAFLEEVARYVVYGLLPNIQGDRERHYHAMHAILARSGLLPSGTLPTPTYLSDWFRKYVEPRDELASTKLAAFLMTHWS